MTAIIFEDLCLGPRRIDVRAKTSDATHDLWFELSQDAGVTSTSVAAALSTLCGRAFSSVHFDFPVADRVIAPIMRLTQADVTSAHEAPSDDHPRRGTLLSFSGGFDSLAARALMPPDTRLVSMDFGGRFSRERKFFETFDTLRVSTNLLTTPFRSNSWSFMGIGAILATDFYRAEYLTFGGILEAGVDNMRITPSAPTAGTFPAFKAAGYTNAPYVLGLTEVGTLMVIMQSNPELVGPSLMSLASPGEEKLYRKSVLARIVADSMGLDVDIDDVAPPPSLHFQFGQNFALDLLALYVISKSDDASELQLVGDVPKPLAELANKLDMSFMERANPTLYEHFPPSLLANLYQKLGKYGIRWYTERDWESFRTVRELLSPFHHI